MVHQEEITTSPSLPKCYLALPVQGVRGNKAFYTKLAFSLRNCGITVINPEVAQPPPTDLDERFASTVIVSDNLRLIDQADFLLADISWPSLGVGYEIAVAERAGIPVAALYCESGHTMSKMMIGNTNRLFHVFQCGSAESLDRLACLALRWVMRVRHGEQVQTNSTERLTTHFAELAPVYDATTQWRRHPQLLEWFKANLGPGDVMLDVGSGTGIIAEAANREGTVVRLDLSESMLRRNSFGARVVGRAECLPVRSGVVDNALMRQVLHYVEVSRVLREIRRTLRPGGRLLLGQVVAPNDNVARWWLELRKITQPLQREIYTVPHLLSVLKEAGFQTAAVDNLTIDRIDTWETFVLHAPGSEALVREYVSLVPPLIARRIGLQTSNEEIAYRQEWGLVVCLP